MPVRVREKVEFLRGQIEGLRARMTEGGNSVQRERLSEWQEILSDYEQSLERANAKSEKQEA